MLLRADGHADDGGRKNPALAGARILQTGQRVLETIGRFRVDTMGMSEERRMHARAVRLADVCAEVFAVRFHHVQHPLIVAVGDQILAEVMQRPDFADREFRRPADHEPTSDFPGERYFHRGASCPRRNDTKYVTV